MKISFNAFLCIYIVCAFPSFIFILQGFIFPSRKVLGRKFVQKNGKRSRIYD